MDKLKSFFSLLTVDQQIEFAESVGTTVSYLRVSISRRQKFKAEMCSAIEKFSGAVVTRKDLRPNDWHLIWPELVESA